MRRRIENIIRIEVEGATLKGATNLEFYIKQRQGAFFSYTPTVVDDTHFEVEIPFEDAMELKPSEAQVQLAFTNENGYPCATDVLTVFVGELLKEGGYAY